MGRKHDYKVVSMTSGPGRSKFGFRHITTLVALAFGLGFTAPANAQSIGIIRDAEVESLIKDFATPLLVAAGIKTTPRVYVVADRRFNAFVVEDGSIFVNYGTIIDVKSALELKAVLAHEIGHLAGGHLARIREQSELTGKLQAVAMLLGIGAAAASSGMGGPTNVGSLATAFVLASQSATENSFLAFRRSEESAADSAALKFLAKTGQSARGMVQVLEYLKTEEVSGLSPFARTHPGAAERLNQVRKVAEAQKAWNRPGNPADEARLDLARAKLVGFLQSQSEVLNLYPNSDKSPAARYARVISAYKGGSAVVAVDVMSGLAASQPRNAYFQELLGQMYYETGHAAKALPPLERAVSLAPKETEIRVLYGQALLDAGGKRNINEAVLQLTRVAQEDPQSVRAFTVLSRAQEALGNQGDASLAAAEAALARGDKGTALGLARQAQKELRKDSPGWLRADDILSLSR